MDITNTFRQRMKYTLCSNKTCCPVLTEIEDDKFILTDDYEGQVVLTKEELGLLKNFLNENLKDK
jgi:hypothetical protein